jgi:polysaccharide biosynthesis transport protein
VRSAEEIGAKLGGLALLARIPSPSKKVRTEHRLVMLDDPTGVQAETFRMLRTNLDFVSLGREARTIMVTSAVEQEGKSTTIANLAIAMARSGQRVVLVDLDLRRPYVDKFFGVQGPGVTQVALGHVPLEDALTTIPIAEVGSRTEVVEQLTRNVRVQGAAANGNGNGNGNGHAKVAKGVLQVLPTGPIPPDPGEFVNTQALSEILTDLRTRFDVVLIDAPPALRVGDAMTLSQKVDGVVVVARMKVVRRQMLTELARQLGAMPTPVLGFIVTASGEEEGYGYGYGYGYYAKPYIQSEPAEQREATKA